MILHIDVKIACFVASDFIQSAQGAKSNFFKICSKFILNQTLTCRASHYAESFLIINTANDLYCEVKAIKTP